jgi:hypothetical protein
VINFVPGPVGQAFLDSGAFLKVICGPVGGGKSTDAFMELVSRAVMQAPFNNVRRTKFVIVRNTGQQLKATVKPLIDDWLGTGAVARGLLPAPLGTWRLTEMVFECRFRLPDTTIVHTEFCLQPVDTPDDIRRLLSAEYSAAWAEEGREIDPEVFSAMQSRTNRYPNRASGGVTFPGAIMSTNPPPMGSWLQEMMANPPANMEVFMQPAALLDDGTLNPEAENLDNLAPDYYENLMTGKTEDWLDVYMRNKFGAGGFGQPVFKKTFRLNFHKAKDPLQLLPVVNYPLIVGCDNGLTAAAVIGQMDARARINILGECYVPEGQTMGFETFLDQLLIPYLRASFPVAPARVVFAMDPACWHRAQLNEATLAGAVQKRGYQTLKASTNDPEKRIAAVEGLLTRAIDGGPGMLVSPNCPWLLKALDWGYRNKKSQAGVVTAVPEKNHYSHIADALQYLSLHYNHEINPGGMYRPQAPVVIRQVSYPYV